jgi:hypothetical protein
MIKKVRNMYRELEKLAKEMGKAPWSTMDKIQIIITLTSIVIAYKLRVPSREVRT